MIDDNNDNQKPEVSIEIASVEAENHESQIVWTDFLTLLKAQPAGKALMKVSVSFYRDGSILDIEPQHETDATIHMSQARLSDNATEMLWNSLVASVESLGFEAYAGSMSVPEQERLRKQKEDPVKELANKAKGLH